MAQLQTLIPELQLEIAKMIAEGPEDFNTTIRDTGYMRISVDLKNLASTCRAFYQITEPLLYARFDTGKACLKKQILYFIRTIMTRPELGRYVRSVSFRVLDEPWWGALYPNCWHETFMGTSHECEDQAAYRRISVRSQPISHSISYRDYMKYTSPTNERDDMLALLKRTFEEAGLFRESFHIYSNSFVDSASSNDALLAGLFLLLPNIEEVKIDCNFPPPHSRIFSLRLFLHTVELLAAGYSKTHRNLRSLKEFTFMSSRAMRPDLDLIQHLFQLPELRLLKLCMPMCSLPRASWTDVTFHPITNKIETLDLIFSGRYFCPPDVNNMFLSTKGLKKLRCKVFASRPSRNFADLGRSLLHFQQTLESLVFCSNFAGRQSIFVDLLGSLHDFPNLGSIEISVEALLGTEENKTTASLYELLPHSLQTLILHVNVRPVRSDIIDQVLALVLRKKTVCPELCDLVISKGYHGTFHPILDELAKECKSMGVVFKCEPLPVSK
jgi:hypothetical protein